VGYGKNRAVEYSSGRFLCFQDAVKEEVYFKDKIDIFLGRSYVFQSN
jgi:hypothetical protein